jgi:hypothetical protein
MGIPCWLLDGNGEKVLVRWMGNNLLGKNCKQFKDAFDWPKKLMLIVNSNSNIGYCLLAPS